MLNLTLPGEGLAPNAIEPYIGHFFYLVVVGYVTWTFYQALFGPTSGIPGPGLARFTRFWLFIETRKGRFEKANIDLHREYGRSTLIFQIWDIASSKKIRH